MRAIVLCSSEQRPPSKRSENYYVCERVNHEVRRHGTSRGTLTV